ncbi:MAG: GNAT family N-acetyltransferase [Tepidiformaceae bacterium]
MAEPRGPFEGAHETTRPEAFVLRDGRELVIRRIQPDDARRLAALTEHLSAEALRLRFFTPVRHLDEQTLRHFSEVDFERRAAFVATFPIQDEVVAVGRYEAFDEHSAEVAFVVLDELHGLGLASELLQHLAALGRQRGFDLFTAMVLAENSEMLDVFRHSGFPMTTSFEAGVTQVRMAIA